MNIYVSNIPYQTTEDELRNAFQQFGNVDSARIIKDKLTGKSRGFGFVEMGNDNEARTALEGINGIEISGRRINAREARPREEAPGGGGGFGGGGGGGGRGGYGGGGGGGGRGGRGGYGGGGGGRGGY